MAVGEKEVSCVSMDLVGPSGMLGFSYPDGSLQRLPLKLPLLIAHQDRLGVVDPGIGIQEVVEVKSSEEIPV